MSNSIQKYCKNFRTKVLKIRLEDMENLTGINSKTISAFENGRSNNINHLKCYVVSCETESQLNQFQQGLNKAVNQLSED